MATSGLSRHGGQDHEAAGLVRARAHPLTGAPDDYDPLLELIGDARFVLLGEASHGTHEFYRQRALITRRLIEERGFHAVVVEADWPDAYRVNRYVRGLSEDGTASEALRDFQRFPAWMWRNADVLDFIGWLRDRNDSLPTEAVKAGCYGMDLYSLYASIEAVIRYLDGVDPEAARRARQRYACFEPFEKDVQAYGYAAAVLGAESCEEDVVKQLVELQGQAAHYAGRGPAEGSATDEYFFAEQNARLAKNAEAYYRAMFRGRHESWNLRDSHMAETIASLDAHITGQLSGRQRAKMVLWAHNSHLGDARATEMGWGGEHNVGQLVRDRYGKAAVLIGFSTYRGTVTAATSWDGPAERKRVRDALSGSYEALFHQAAHGPSSGVSAGTVARDGAPEMLAFLLPLRSDSELTEALREPRLERAIGVIYRPQTERWSHYFDAVLPDQFDAVLHFDETRAVEPLERTPRWQRGSDDGDLPETYPVAV